MTSGRAEFLLSDHGLPDEWRILLLALKLDDTEEVIRSSGGTGDGDVSSSRAPTVTTLTLGSRS